MSTPLQSFIGGLCLPIPVHTLLVLNGSVFGISGFVHRAVRGSYEGLMAVAGLVLGGIIVAAIEGTGQYTSQTTGHPFEQLLISGFLVGLGTKLANGCTSGHMISGLSRFSVRSVAATVTFFSTAVITALIMHNDLPALGPPDWSLGPNGVEFLALQALPFMGSILLYKFAPALHESSIPLIDGKQATDAPQKWSPVSKFLRGLASLLTALHFAFGLRLSNLSEPRRILGFLVLPFNSAFDTSLACLAVGALPLAILLNRYGRGNEEEEVPRLGGPWKIPPRKQGEVDVKLLLGSVIFGVGWGVAGVCPGPGLLNLGRALGSGSGLKDAAGWVGAMALGGMLA